jgi:hypothetical protein
MLLILSRDETADATWANALHFTGIEIEKELEAVAAGIRALHPA